VGPSAGLDAVVKRKIPVPIDHPAPSSALTTHLQLAPRLRTREAIPALPHTSSWLCT